MPEVLVGYQLKVRVENQRKPIIVPSKPSSSHFDK